MQDLRDAKGVPRRLHSKAIQIKHSIKIDSPYLIVELGIGVDARAAGLAYCAAA
jgi:hypothetical protein